MVEELSTIMTCLGEYDLKTSLLKSSQTLEGLPVLLLLFVISCMSKLEFDKDFSTLIRCKAEYPIDGWPLVVGVGTLLKQFHYSYTKSFLALISQYIKSLIKNKTETKQLKTDDKNQLSIELKNTIIFVSQMGTIGCWSRSMLFEYIPQHLLEMCIIIH